MILPLTCSGCECLGSTPVPNSGHDKIADGADVKDLEDVLFRFKLSLNYIGIL